MNYAYYQILEAFKIISARERRVLWEQRVFCVSLSTARLLWVLPPLRNVKGNFMQHYRDRLKCIQILLINNQAGPGRAVEQEQENNSRNHVQNFWPTSVQGEKQQQQRRRNRFTSSFHIKSEIRARIERGSGILWSKFSQATLENHFNCGPENGQNATFL